MEQVGRTSGILQARARPKENQPFYRPTVLLEGVSQQDHQEQASYLGLNKKKQKKRMGDDPTFFCLLGSELIFYNVAKNFTNWTCVSCPPIRPLV